jgi:hypothetical protein
MRKTRLWDLLPQISSALEQNDAQSRFSMIGAPVVYHNSMWARYKGAILFKIFALGGLFKLNVEFIHVAETSQILEGCSHIVGVPSDAT